MRGFYFPDRLFCKLQYTDEPVLSGTNTYHNVYRGNSPYDPDFSLGGTTATGYSQFCGGNGPYLNYCCFGSKIIVNFMRTDTGTGPIEMFLLPSVLTTVSSTSSTQLRPQKYCKFRFVTNYQNSKSSTTIGHYFTTSKMYGRKSILSEDDFSAQYNANPVNEWFWNIVVQDPALTTTVTGKIWVKVKYYMCFWNRVPEAAP